MATSNRPLAPNPQTDIDRPQPLPDPPQEDLTEAVPLGESEDDGFILEEEDPEYAPPAGSQP